MDGVHEMAAEIFVQLIAARAAAGPVTTQGSADVARDSYIYARTFFDEHGRHLERGA
jgi:hypothetical protein